MVTLKRLYDSRYEKSYCAVCGSRATAGTVVAKEGGKVVGEKSIRPWCLCDPPQSHLNWTEAERALLAELGCDLAALDEYWRQYHEAEGRMWGSDTTASYPIIPESLRRFVKPGWGARYEEERP